MDTDEITTKKVHRAVRNIIFNEIKLTRSEVENIIMRVARDQADAIISNRHGLEKMVDRMVRQNIRMYPNLEAFVKAEVVRQVQEHVKKMLEGRLRIDIETETSK